MLILCQIAKTFGALEGGHFEPGPSANHIWPPLTEKMRASSPEKPPENSWNFFARYDDHPGQGC